MVDDEQVFGKPRKNEVIECKDSVSHSWVTGGSESIPFLSLLEAGKRLEAEGIGLEMLEVRPTATALVVTVRDA